MNHNYKLADFKKPEFKTDTDIKDITVTMCLRDNLELPSVLEQRFEDIVNNLISEYEQKNDVVIPLEDMDLETCLSVQRETNELLIEVCIGFDADKELLHRKEIITAEDEHYTLIKKFFFDRLNDYAVAEIKKIEDCLKKVIYIPDLIPVNELANKLGTQPSQIVKCLFLNGEVVNYKTVISFEIAKKIEKDFEVTFKRLEESTNGNR